MRNVSYVGFCLVMSLSLVAVAVGEQPPTKTWQNAPQLAPQTIDTSGLPLEKALQPAQQGQDGVGQIQAGTLGGAENPLKFNPQPAPNGTHDRSLITVTHDLPEPAVNQGRQRGQFGVWMGEADGAGVRILRVTGGSPAERAGLRVGDIILQVNGRGATSPIDTAKLIRQIAIGDTGTLTIWRDGSQQQVQVALKAVGEIARETVKEPSNRVGIGHSDSADSDLASRTMRLEQQINSLTKELATLRQELTQLRTAGPVQTGFNAEANQGPAPRETTRYNITTIPAPERAKSGAAAAAPAIPIAPSPGFEPPKATPAEPAADAAKSAALPAAAPTPAPAAEKSAPNDLFESEPAQPKSEEKPKTEDNPKADDKAGSDDLFK